MSFFHHYSSLHSFKRHVLLLVLRYGKQQGKVRYYFSHHHNNKLNSYIQELWKAKTNIDPKLFNILIQEALALSNGSYYSSRVTLSSWNLILTQCCSSRETHHCIKPILKKMLELGHVPYDNILSTVLTSIYYDDKQLNEIFHILETFNINLNVRHFGSLFKHSNIDTTLQIYHDWMKNKVKPNSILFTMLISSCMKDEKWKDGELIISEMKQLSRIYVSRKNVSSVEARYLLQKKHYEIVLED